MFCVEHIKHRSPVALTKITRNGQDDLKDGKYGFKCFAAKHLSSKRDFFG